VVARVVYGSNSFLFMGDAEKISENLILSKKLTIKSDVLKVGHHGSNISTNQALLNAVNPKYAIISVGANNSYGQPSSTTLNKLKTKSIKTYRTDLNGTVTASSNGSQIVLSVQKNTLITPVVVPKPRTVYFTPSGKSYHYDRNCSTLSRSKVVLSGTIQDAINSGHADPCDKCVK
jgi:competence protein ComEC